MGKSSSNDELTIRNQFDRICKLALKGEAADYYRHIAYRQKHEVLFSELSQKELDSIFGVDKYTVENKCLSTRKMYDENRQVHYCVDETLRRRLETKLITKILAFEI